MKKILLLLLVLLLSMSFMLVGCDEGEVPDGDKSPEDEDTTDETPDDETPDDETPEDEDETPVSTSFAFGDITMRVGESIPLLTTLKDGSVNRALTYTAGGSQITVTGGKLTAKAVTSGVAVSVSAEGFSASFTVKVIAAAAAPTPNYGQMTITHPSKIYTNYSGGAVVASFSNPDYATGVVYSSDTDGVYVQNGKVTARGIFHRDTVATITAKSEYHTTSFKVTVSTYTSRSAETKVGYYEREKIKPENQGGIIFVGDSYFDGYPGSDGKPPFWKEFATDFGGENAHLFGLSSARIDNLEMISERVVYPMNPREIVVHIGFNDVHDGIGQNLSDTEAFAKVDELATRIQALLNKYKEELPNVHVYYLGVEAKRSASSTKDGTGSAHYNSTYKYAPRLSDKMKAFANGKDWCTFIDTGALTYNQDRTDVVTTYYGDNSHLSVAGYQELTKLLNNARATRPVAPTANDFTIASSSTAIQDTAHYIKYMGNNLTTDYVLEGTMEITRSTSTGTQHVQLRFNNNSGGSYDRFLILDGNKDGVFGVGYTKGTVYKDETGASVSDGVLVKQITPSAISSGQKLTISFAVAVTNDDAYLFIGGEMVAKLTGLDRLEYFNIGAQNVGISVKNMTLTVKKYSATDYSAKLSALGITY